MKKFDIGENVFILALIMLALLPSVVFREPKQTAENTQETEIKSDTVAKLYDHRVVLLSMIDEYGAQEPTRESVLYVMNEVGVEHPHIVYAQMLLESGHFSSRLAKTNNNYFGMKQPSKRRTVSLGIKNGYASYENWAYSVLDYALWQWDYAKNLTEDEYLALLGRMYAEDAEYVNKVRNISENLI